MSIDYVGYIFAAIVAAGGVYGYVKADSIPSLVAGLVFGIILGVGAYLNSQSPPKPLLQLGTALVLAAMMYFRWAKSGKFMPPGIIAVLSTVLAVLNVIVFRQHLPLIGNGQS